MEDFELDVKDFINLIPELKLSIDFPFEPKFRSEVSDTIKLGIDCNVKELNLILKNGNIDASSFFPLPSFLNENSVLEKLNLSMCSFDSFQEIKWDSLKVLKISYTCLENSCIENIVSGCPVLEELELCNCWGFTQLNFDDLTMLNKFVLDGIWPKVVKDKKKTGCLNISAANVEVLEILGNLDQNDLVLGDFSNCIEAIIDYFWTFEEERPRRRPLTLQLVFNQLKNVRILTCGDWIIEAVSEKAEMPYALGNCSSLTLHAPVEYQFQLGIMHFIRSSPDVETLRIYASFFHTKVQIGDIGEFPSFSLPSSLHDNSVFQRLNLSMCNLYPTRQIKWDSLKVLKISYSYLNNSYIKKIVSGCEVLEVFELCNCWGFSKLNLDDLTMLKRFVLDGIWPRVVKERAKTDSLSISAASVQVLEILGYLDEDELVLGDVSNCIEAKIDYFWNVKKDKRRPLTMQQVFNSLKNVRILTCGTWIIEAVSDKFQVEFPYALGNCNSLTLHAPVEYRYQLGIMHFIESCPDLEILIIDASLSHTNLQSDISDRNEINREVDNMRKAKFSSGFPFKVLKMLSCDEGTNYSTLPLFFKYLIKFSKFWKEMVIQYNA